jgi:hypothetical protein
VVSLGRCGVWTADCARNYLHHNNTANIPQAGSIGQRDPLLTVVKDGLEKGIDALPADWETSGFFPEVCAFTAAPYRDKGIDAWLLARGTRMDSCRRSQCRAACCWRAWTPFAYPVTLRRVGSVESQLSAAA